jgi:hypothetical protein
MKIIPQSKGFEQLNKRFNWPCWEFLLENRTWNPLLLK